MQRKTGRVLLTLLLFSMGTLGSLLATDVKKLRRAPDFVLPDWQKDTISLADFRGRVVLLQFFQTACPACQREAPLLEELYRKFKDKGLVVVGVSHDAGGAEAVKQFAKQFDITYFLLLGDLEVAVRYIGITPQQSSFDVPRFFLIDREGYVFKDIDPAHDAEFRRDEKGVLTKVIEETLNNPQPARPPSTASSN
jgi:peroxiredoxin